MIRANLKLKSYFFLKEGVSNWQILGDINLSNGKRYKAFLVPREKKIIIGNYPAKETELYSGEALTAEERVAIIELLLGVYGTYFNSIFHLSASHNIELYKLIDSTTGKPDRNKDGMIYEYLKNVKLEESQKPSVFTALKQEFDYFMNNKDNIKEGVILEIDKRISKINLEFLSKYVLDYFKLEEKYKVVFNKQKCTLELKVKE